jgi:2-amino-4-hydroxy-6-hydroxymethyldihydropteridine diphosphokinase
MRVIAISRVYETDPVGGPEQGAYLNAVVAIDTALAPHELFAFAQDLERVARRVRDERWGPRTLDVDLLLFGDEHVDTAELTIPHPRMWERGFVLAPLRDVAPALVPPDATWKGVHAAPVELRHPWSSDNAPSR